MTSLITRLSVLMMSFCLSVNVMANPMPVKQFLTVYPKVVCRMPAVQRVRQSTAKVRVSVHTIQRNVKLRL